MFQRHCFHRFSRDVQLQRLRDGPRHLLLINLTRAANRRGGCDGEHSWVCKSNVQNCKASLPPTTQTSLASPSSPICYYIGLLGFPQGPLASHACSCLPLKLLGGILHHSSYSNTTGGIHVVKNRQKFI